MTGCPPLVRCPAGTTTSDDNYAGVILDAGLFLLLGVLWWAAAAYNRWAGELGTTGGGLAGLPRCQPCGCGPWAMPPPTLPSLPLLPPTPTQPASRAAPRVPDAAHPRRQPSPLTPPFRTPSMMRKLSGRERLRVMWGTVGPRLTIVKVAEARPAAASIWSEHLAGTGTGTCGGTTPEPSLVGGWAGAGAGQQQQRCWRRPGTACTGQRACVQVCASVCVWGGGGGGGVRPATYSSGPVAAGLRHSQRQSQGPRRGAAAAAVGHGGGWPHAQPPWPPLDPAAAGAAGHVLARHVAAPG
jgi:hypothetical protein